MTAQEHGNNSQGAEPPVVRFNSRRNQAFDMEARAVTFAKRGLDEAKLSALRQFLASASGDEIEMIRTLYGDVPEVLEFLGLDRRAAGA